MGVITKKIYNLTGLSTETKPILGDMATGSTFIEEDTGSKFVYNNNLNCWVFVGKVESQEQTIEPTVPCMGILSIELTSTEGLVDTYTITYTNGATTTFTVTNGTKFEVNTGFTPINPNKIYTMYINNSDAYNLYEITKLYLDFERTTADFMYSTEIPTDQFWPRNSESKFSLVLSETDELIFYYRGFVDGHEAWEAIDIDDNNKFIRYVGSFEYVGPEIEAEAETNNSYYYFKAKKQTISFKSLESLINAEASRAMEEENQLNADLTTEVGRATDAEAQLNSKIDQEISDRITAVSTEETRAQAVEQTLTTDLNNEVIRATSAESGLSSRIDSLSASLTQEIQNRQSADETLTTNLNTEISNRTNADATLQGNIDSEASTRENADSTLQDNIDTEQERALLAEETLITSVNNINLKIPDAASENNQLADKDFVNSSISTNTATFRGSYNIVTDLGLTTSATEQQIAVAIANKMQTESITPTNNDYVFVCYPDDVVTTQYTKFDRYKYDGTTWGYEYTLNNSSFTAEQWAAINSNITAELTAQITANENAIDAEASAARLAEEQLQTNINAVSGNLNIETTDRTNADTNLQNQIDTLSGSLSSETTARSTKDSELETNISNEVTRAQTAESVLSSDIDDYSFKNTTNQNIETWVEYAKNIVWPQEINN